MKCWPTKPLGELCDVEGGNAAPQGDEHFKGGTIPFVRMKDLGRPHFTNNLTETDDKLTEASATTNRMKFFEPGCILFPRSGSVALNHRAILGVRACIVSHIGVLQNLRPEITAGYLYIYLTTFDMTALSKKTTGVDSIAFADVKQIPVPVPPLAEQERIVKLLDEADELRKLRTQTDRRSAALIPALFHEMFGDPFHNLKGLPVVRVEEAGRVQLGRQRAPKYQTGKFTCPYIRVANVFEDRIDVSDLLSMDFDERDFKQYRLENGDILLNEGQSTELVGRPAIWRNEVPDCCFQNTLVRFQADKKKVLPDFALALFLTNFRSGEFAKISSKTSNVAHLGAARFAKMPFLLPPLPLQQEFAQRVTEIRELEAAQAASRQRVEHLFQSMLHRAFNQEL